MPIHRSLFVAVLLTSGLLEGVAAQDADCTTSLGDVEVAGNLNIAGRCQLTGTEVGGNVILFEGGSLIARNARIGGNLEARRADFVNMDRSVVDGNVRLEELVGDSSTIQQTDVGGNTTLSSNRSRLQILNNDLAGNLRATRNTGGLVISGNGIEGNLDCTGNSPEPTGLGNRVDGDTKGQCRNLAGESGGDDEEQDDEPEDQPEDEPEDEETPRPPPTSSPPAPSPPTAPPPSSPPPTARPPQAPPMGSPPAPSPPTTTAPPSAPAPSAPAPSAPAPPASTEPPPAPAPAPAGTLVEDDGGAGATGWPFAFLLPLLAWRAFARRRQTVL